MATKARILVLLMAVLAFANAQCLTWCAIQPCHAQPSGHCPQHSGKTAPSCAHGQFVKTAEIQDTPSLNWIDAATPELAQVSPLLALAAEINLNPGPPLTLADLPSLSILRI
jgi:hypothetical protein